MEEEEEVWEPTYLCFFKAGIIEGYHTIWAEINGPEMSGPNLCEFMQTMIELHKEKQLYISEDGFTIIPVLGRPLPELIEKLRKKNELRR